MDKGGGLPRGVRVVRKSIFSVRDEEGRKQKP